MPLARSSHDARQASALIMSNDTRRPVSKLWPARSVAADSMAANSWDKRAIIGPSEERPACGSRLSLIDLEVVGLRQQFRFLGISLVNEGGQP